MPEKKNNFSTSPFRVVLPYLLISIIWILCSDYVLAALVKDADSISRLQTYKGISFVLITAILLYFLSVGNIRSLKKIYQDKIDQERIYRALFENASDLILLTNDLGKVIMANNVERLLGYSFNDFVAANFFDLIHTSDISLIKSFIANSKYNKEKHLTTICRLKHKNGEYVWFEISIENNINDPSISGVIFNARDITERKKAESQIKSNELLFLSVFEQAVVGMALVDRNGKRFQVNDKLCSITGYPKEEQLTISNKDLIYIDDLEQEAELYRQLINLEIDGATSEHRVNRKDGQICWVSKTINSVKDEDGNTLYFAVLVIDITNRKNAELALNNRNKELDTFIYRSSHDLRGPITTLLGLADIARIDIREPKALEYFSYVQDIALKLEKILTNLIEVSQIKYKPLLADQLKPMEMVEGIINKFTINNRVFIENVEVAIAPNLVINTDLSMMHAVLFSLIENAILFRKFEVRDHRIRVQVALVDNNIEIIVSDNGLGIKEEELEKVFELFYNGKNPARGSGIGLYLVKMAINKLNGEVKIDSKLGLGTQVKVVIPNM